MKRVSVFLLFLLLSTNFALAEEIAYVSFCRNGSPATLEALKLLRSGPAAKYAVADTASLILPKTCGLTDIQHQGPDQLHVYYTDSVGNKIRIVRETLDKSTFEFLSNQRKAFPANLADHLNFDTNDVHLIGLRATANRLLHSKKINAAGSPAGGFKKRGSTPFTPFNSHISNEDPFFTTSLWTDSASGRTGITFQNFLSPANPVSFLFTNSVFAHDTTVSFPRPSATSSRVSADDDFFWVAIYEFLEVLGAAPAQKNDVVATTTGAPFIRKIQRSDFSPVGNVLRLDKNRTVTSTSPIGFNGLAIDPLGTVIAYVREKSSCGSNELIVQTFDPIKGKKVKGAKVAFPCNRSFVVFGISVLNEAFLNGVTN